MPEFRHPDQARLEADGQGWRLSVLADAGGIESLTMAARRWSVEPGRRTSERSHPGPGERFLYVVAGRGWAWVGGERLELGPEDMVWIEPGDSFALQAAKEALEVLDASSQEQPQSPPQAP